MRDDDGRLAGSVLGLDQAVRNLVAFTGCAWHDAVATVTSVPSRLLGDGQRGVIRSGARADLVLLDDDLSVHVTVVGGEVAYRDRLNLPGAGPSTLAPFGTLARLWR